MGLQTIHESTCDRCGQKKLTPTPRPPAGWRTVTIHDAAQNLICSDCRTSLNRWFTHLEIADPELAVWREAARLTDEYVGAHPEGGTFGWIPWGPGCSMYDVAHPGTTGDREREIQGGPDGDF